MDNKKECVHKSWLENPNFSEALDKVIQESRERLKQKRYHQNKRDDDQNYNRGNDQNDNANSDDYSCYDYIVSSC